MKPNIWEIIEGKVYLVELDPGIAGFRDFLGAWVVKGEYSFVVDVGPAVSIPILCEALSRLDVKPEAVLLTHIHIDHAGGIGDFCSRFPDIPVFCHEKGIKHLHQPEKLWEGSLKTLGSTAKAYGPIQGVPKENLFPAAGTIISENGVQVDAVLTPGHAPHHVSYCFEDILFAGEASGVCLKTGEKNYHRPATPPRFFLETSVKSIDTLLDIPSHLICFGHFGAYRQPRQILKEHKKQLYRWAEIIEGQMRNPNIKNKEEETMEQCLDVLLQEDPALSPFFRMDSKTREREKGFLQNSIRGFLLFLEEQQTRT